MPKLPPLNALRAFEAAGRHLNFRLAAEEIGVTQGAVAQQVRGLEARLGLSLFYRQPRGLRLTEAGRRYHAPLCQAFRLIADATGALSDRQHLTISVTPSFAAKWLVPRLGAFADAHPEIEVQVDAGERLANFQNDGIDIAVRQGRPPFGPGLKAEPLFGTEYVAVCSPDLAGRITEPQDLLGVTLLNDTHGLWPLFLEQAGCAGQPRIMNFSQTSLAIDAAAAGQGVALANAPLVTKELEARRLVQPVDLSLTADLGFYVITPVRSKQPRLAAIMRDWLLAQA